MDRIDYLLMQKESGVITLAEQKELSLLLADKDENGYLADAVNELFRSRLKYRVDKKDVEKGLALLHQRLKKERDPLLPVTKRPQSRRFRYAAAAAAMVALVAGAVWLWSNGSGKTDKQILPEHVVTTPKGSKTDLVLPDGTRVWLNAASQLSYPKDYGNALRNVFLEGEAFFEVKEDKTRPFIVHTKTLDVKVLGTVFNVKAYAGEENTEAVLISGTVEVQVKNGKKGKITLTPHEKIVVRNEPEAPVLKPGKPEPEVQLFPVRVNKADSTSDETQWTHNRIVFDNEKLQQIIPQLERWYNVQFELKTRENSRLYNGTFENDNLEDVLKALQVIGKFNYKIDKNRVIIY
jgi:ferric-dicitrate binding protein FerR (iron transport regulator)